MRSSGGGAGEAGGGGWPGRETTVTVAELYAVYRSAYDAFDRMRPSGAPPSEPISRAVVEFAELDALDGVAPRSREDFERCLARGAGALGPLGLRAA